jgi:type II secretory ATPase GspE/PulE/Tfp pilus assembly ATPase PilB-like protein
MTKASPPGSPDFTELGNFKIHPGSIRLLKFKYCLQNRVVVLGQVDPGSKEPVTLGMLDPGDSSLCREVEARLSRPVKGVQLSSYEIKKALLKGFGEDEQACEFRLTLKPVRAISFSPETPITDVLNEVLGRAVQMRATDVHIETYEDDVDVRFRIDGLLYQVGTPLNRENVQAAVSRLKVLADLDIGERRRSQDGRILAVYEVDGARRNVDCRLSVVPGPFGEDAVMRVLDSAHPVMGLARLGLTDADRGVFEELVSSPEGLVLVTGPTGSGKTTTLYAAIAHVNTPNNKILTVEDPIEYSFEKVNQKQVGSAMGFADYARAFMRQNPDIILIGEIRDEDTAQAAIRAAQTGHLVLSTLHTNDAVRAVPRLRTLGIDANLVAGCLLGVLSQRLVRRICEACKEEVAADERERRRLFLGAAEARFFRGKGCAACDGDGYTGRTGVYELFVPDEEITDLITAGTPVQQIRRRAREKGMRSLLDDALEKARGGLTSLAEILRVVPYRIIAAERGGGDESAQPAR